MELKAIPTPDYRSHPAYGGLFGPPTFFQKFEAFKRFAPRFADKFRGALSNRRNLPARLVLSDRQKEGYPFLADFIRDGAAPFKLSPEEKNNLIKNSEAHISALKNKKRSVPVGKRRFKHKVSNISKNEDPNLYSIVQNILRRRKIIEAASIYRGYQLDLKNIFIQLGDPEDRDWRDHFLDIKISDPETGYMHVDSKLQVIKCLIYLSEVGMENGPTAYVLGSNRFKSGFLEYVTRKANDDSRLDLCDSENRKLFNALPRFLQKKAEFGNDLLDSDPRAQELLAREKKFTSQDGDLFLIDTDGVHRGGMVQEGERLMLQAIFG